MRKLKVDHATQVSKTKQRLFELKYLINIQVKSNQIYLQCKITTQHGSNTLSKNNTQDQIQKSTKVKTHDTIHKIEHIMVKKNPAKMNK